MSQYKRCNAINDQQLRDASNIKELVQIEVATLPKQSFAGSRGGPARRAGTQGDQVGINLQFDPVRFR